MPVGTTMRPGSGLIEAEEEVVLLLDSIGGSSDMYYNLLGTIVYKFNCGGI